MDRFGEWATGKGTSRTAVDLGRGEECGKLDQRQSILRVDRTGQICAVSLLENLLGSRVRQMPSADCMWPLLITYSNVGVTEASRTEGTEKVKSRTEFRLAMRSDTLWRACGV